MRLEGEHLPMLPLLNDAEIVDRVLGHVANHTTDLGQRVWHEPVENYRSTERFAAEVSFLRSVPTAFCPSAALPETGSFVAREVMNKPVVAVRGTDGRVRAFVNVCRHRGMRLV